jgi:arsenical pump membrane protein
MEQTTEQEDIKINTTLLVIGLIHLISATILIAIASYINLEMWIITLCFAISLLISASIYILIKKENFSVIGRTLKRAPYSLIPFVLSMFVIVLSLNDTGITEKLSNFFNSLNPIYSFGMGGALTANFINNIPMSVLFANMALTSNASIYASIIASNIAAYITPVGALAGIMWMSLLKTYEVNFSFKNFVCYGVTIGIPTLLAALLSLSIIL